jgi:hypothetical protein
VIFRETTLFTKQVVEKLTDSDYRELQAALMLRPELGDLIPETGGLRKVDGLMPVAARGSAGACG